MRKFLGGLIFTILVSFVFIHFAQAQLINYDRRSRTPGQAPERVSRPATPAASSYSSRAVATPSVPSWQTVEPPAESRLERQYDFNRDGKLQSSEVKQYLRYIIRQVEREGTYQIRSDFLRIYDKDGDGAITKFEIDAINEDILN